jgi:GntR family transcriptional regulator/MocR family aminotransferase
MPVEWSGLGPELLVELDRGLARPLRSQVEDQLRAAIQTGRLAGGERLPSSRELASQLSLSRGLIQECYVQLQAEGYLTARGGSATRVAPAPLGGRATTTPHPAGPATAASAASSSAFSTAASAARRHSVANFESGVPDLALAPRDEWSWAIREACRTAPNLAFDYGDPQGAPRLREVLTAYLRRVRAVDTVADLVVVCGGFAQGLTLVLRALARDGYTRVAFEDPGSVASITRAANAAGSQVVPVPVDELGIDVDALAASGARVVVLTPAHQWPTGVVLAGERRLELIAWARAHDAFVIEDDYDAEFRYDREPVGSLQGLAPDRVIALGTVSKSLAPALRLGWAVAPMAIVDAVTFGKQVADRGTPGLDQLALAALIESGRYDRHLRRMRTEYSARRDAVVEAFGAHAAHVRISGLAAGFHAVAHLPDSLEEQDVIRQAAELGVGVYGMSTYRSNHDTRPPQLVIGFGNTSIRAIHAGIDTIAPLLALHGP